MEKAKRLKEKTVKVKNINNMNDIDNTENITKKKTVKKKSPVKKIIFLILFILIISGSIFGAKIFVDRIQENGGGAGRSIGNVDGQ